MCERLGVLGFQPFERLVHFGRGLFVLLRRRVLLESGGYRVLDLGADLCETFRQMFGARPVQAHGHHAAADVYTDCSRNDRAVSGDDAPDRRAHAPMHVGHRGDVFVDERQRRDIAQLLERGFFHGHAARPRFDRLARPGV